MAGEPGNDSSGKRSELEQNLRAHSTWLRLVFMIVIAICHELARLVGAVIVLLQFLHVLFTGKPNERLKDAGLSLAQYVYQVVEYLTFNTEVRPFPFDAEWPAPRRQ
jgi:Flp pilus assembly protein TadB